MMKRLLEVGVAIALSFGAAGCDTFDSLNVQRSLLRGTGDGGITTVLENQDEDKVQEIADGVKDICNDVLNFLDSGEVADLTKGELKDALLDVVPAGSADFVNDIIGLITATGIDVDVDGIGSHNVKRIKAFIKGVIRGADEYSVEDRD